MRHRTLFILLILALFAPGTAGAQTPPCAVEDKLCLLIQLQDITAKIAEQNWRDQSYRELGKSYAYAGYPDEAISLIPLITNPDTKAMTIRGIGMAQASLKQPPEVNTAVFEKLAQEAAKIDHAPSLAIAETYIAMAQAFAGDDAGAMKTAAAMHNAALKHKAYGETAEIQAQRGDFNAAMISLAAIDSASYRNKSCTVVSKIFTEKGMLKEAYATALKIDNPAQQAQALQVILNHGNSEEELPRD